MKYKLMKILFLIIVFLLSAKTNYAQEIKGEILQEDGNLIVIKVWGTHQERGFASGYLLANKIVSMHNNYFRPRFGSYLEMAKEMIVNESDFTIPSEYIQEAKAMIDGMEAGGADLTDFDYRDILLENSFLDLENMSSLKNSGIDLRNGCSSLLSWGEATAGTSLNGKSVISRHVDWEAHPSIVGNHTIIVHIPSEADEQPWLMIGFIGQMSALSGVNQSGLCLFNQVMPGYGEGSHGKAYEPIWFTIRKSLEKKDFNGDSFHDTRDVRDAVLTNPNGYADGFIISSLAPSTAGVDSLIAMISEVTPTEPFHTFRSNNYDDMIPGDNVYVANEAIARNDVRKYCTRYSSITNCMNTNVPGGTGISELKNWNLMRDCSNLGDANIQFMQIIPELNILNFSRHNVTPAYQNDSIHFDLKELFTDPNPDLIIDSNTNQSDFSIYPNPVKEQFTIELEDNLQIISIELLNASGMGVSNIIIPSNSASIVNTNLMDTGLYFLKINTDNKSHVVKLIKQ